MNNVVTCVYCGHEYPEGTPTSQATLLTEHIKTCEKHPMKQLRSALVGVIGVDGREGLEQLEITARTIPAVERDRIAVLNAVHALLDTLPEDKS